MTRYLTEDEVAELLSPADAFAAVEESFARAARGSITEPPRERLVLEDGVFATMPCVDVRFTIDAEFVPSVSSDE